MEREESRLRRDVAVTLYKHGKSIEECARITGYKIDSVRRILTAHGLWETKWKVDTNREQKVLEMLDAGYSAKDIAGELGYSGPTSVYRIAQKAGISVKWKKQQMAEREVVMREYKSEGHTHQEVAERFGVSKAISYKACKGVAPQTTDPEYLRRKSEEQNRKTLADREAKAVSLIKNAGFVYVGGFTNTDGTVTIRCPDCGYEFERSMITLRHHDTVICPRCREIAEEEKKRATEERRVQFEAERKAAKEERERRKKEEAEIKRQSRIHECPVCGQLTTEKKYCSKECANKVQNARREMRRRIRINGALVDKDITLQKLYNRDHGICYLCGKECDWDDKEERNGTIICGNDYPSIEHVVPLSRGGEHSWENVKLACRGCNTKKHTSLLTTISSPTISA